MSRGPGRVGKGIEAALADHDGGMTCRDLAIAVYGEDFTESDLTSIRRAVRGLEQRGKVWTAWESIGSRDVERPVGYLEVGAGFNMVARAEMITAPMPIPAKMVYLVGKLKFEGLDDEWEDL
jgi:hypothetical protein